MDRWDKGTRADREKSETKAERQKRPTDDKTGRQTWGQMGSERDKCRERGKLGVVPAQIKAHGLEVKGCGLCR